MMYGLIDNATGECLRIVSEPELWDLTACTAVPVPAPTENHVWDVAAQQFVARPPTPAEATSAALDSDVRWAAMRAAAPDQVEAWLTNNVTDLASARRVLKILIMAVQKLDRTR